MGRTFDVIVLGLGGMGSAAAYQLASRGKRVLGIEQFTAPHDRGSSHGKTRIVRQAYFENPAYVPLVLRAYELWRQLERETGRRLLFEVGGLMMGPPNSAVVAGSIRSAREHGLAHEILDAREIRKRFPAFRPEPNTVALHENKAGFIRCEDSVQAHLDRASHLGAVLHFEERVVAWEPCGDRVRVRIAKDKYEAGQLVIAPGPWASEILRDLDLPLVVDRHVLFWLDPVGGVGLFLPGHFPVFIWETESPGIPYGFPAVDGPNAGVKVGFGRAPGAQKCTPETIDRVVRPEEIESIRRAFAKRVPSLDGRCLRAVTCMYTNTPDHDFVISRHPDHPSVLVACGFSGHGYKFCSVVGEILADLVVEGKTRHDISLFDAARLRSARGPR